MWALGVLAYEAVVDAPAQLSGEDAKACVGGQPYPWEVRTMHVHPKRTNRASMFAVPFANRAGVLCAQQHTRAIVMRGTVHCMPRCAPRH